jgi:hypothetical protein
MAKGNSYSSRVSAPRSTHGRGKTNPKAWRPGGFGTTASTGKQKDTEQYPAVAPTYGSQPPKYP